MDMMTEVDRSRAGLWTDEKHVNFLNSMEASFVRTMFENSGSLHQLRLDRDMPDTCDSTLDSKPQKRRKNIMSSVDIIGPKGRTNSKRTRRKSYQPYTSSQDQVVPQLDFKRGGGDKYEGDPPHPDVDVAPAN